MCFRDSGGELPTFLRWVHEPFAGVHAVCTGQGERSETGWPPLDHRHGARSAWRGECGPLPGRRGCSPVRIVESQDGSSAFVSARGHDVVLDFGGGKLVADPEHAFRRAIPSAGAALGGLRLFAKDRQLAVANTNRFGDPSKEGCTLRSPFASEKSSDDRRRAIPRQPQPLAGSHKALCHQLQLPRGAGDQAPLN